MGEMEFRFNLVIWSVVNIFWAAIFIFMINIIYGHVNSLAGWSKQEATVLVMVQSLFISFLWAFVLPNLKELSNLIRTGGLDFLLLKPLNLRFLTSVKVQEFDMYLRALVLVVVLSIYVPPLFHPTLTSALNFTALLILGVIIFYNVFFMFATTNFWLINIFNIDHLYSAITDIATFPSGIFTGLLKITFVYLLPTIFIATIPTQALLGKTGLESVLIALGVAIVTYFVSHKFWNFALRHYSSASS